MKQRFSVLSLAALAAISFLKPSPMHGQTERSRAYTLSPGAQSTVERLGGLATLSADDWQYHAGPLAHGEDPALDTAGWETIHIPVVKPGEELWLRRWIEWPPANHGYDLRGARLMFGIDVGGDGPGRGYMQEALFVNGQRIQEGLHLDLHPLFTGAVPGQKILVALHMPATLERKHFERVHTDFILKEDRPNPTVLRAELLSAAQLVRVLDMNEQQQKSGEETLEASAVAVDWAALDRGDQVAFDLSLRKAEVALEPLRPALQRGIVTLTGNAHIDAAWLWTASETVDQVHFTFGNAVALMREHPEYRFAQSSAQYYEWMEQKFPELFAEIQRQVKAGRWEPVGGMWVEPDLNMPDGESQVRQLLLGKRYFADKFGVDVRVGWNPDSFGFNWQLPQIYKKSGIDFFLTQKLHYNDHNLLPLKLFWWQAPDGSRILTYFPHDYVQEVEPVYMARDLAQAALLNPGNVEMMHLYGPSLGRLALQPGRKQLEAGDLWSGSSRVFPRVAFRTAQSFFEDMASRLASADFPQWSYRTFAAGVTQLPPTAPGKIALPVWNDELYLEHHRGTYTTQAGQKANMRHSENWLVDAEKFASLGWLAGVSYPGTALTSAWKKKSFNDSHDSAAGTGIAQIVREAEADYETIRWTAEEAERNAKSALSAHINTASAPGVPLLIWNSLSWDRTDVAEVEVQMPASSVDGVHFEDVDGKPVAAQMLTSDPGAGRYHVLLETAVPSLGYTIVRALPGGRAVSTDLSVQGLTLENALVGVTLDAGTGCIVHLIEKTTGFDSVAPGTCGNLLQLFGDHAAVEDAWNIDADFEKQRTDLTQAKSVRVVESGPVRAVIRVTRAFGSSTLTQDITLYAHLPRVDVVNKVDWHEQQKLLKAGFELAASGPTATYEIPFGSIERPTTRNNASERERFEVPAIRWADLGDGHHGISLMNESKFGYDAKDNRLRLSLLRSPLYPDPTADRGVQQFTYSVLPHAGTWKAAGTVLRALELSRRLTAQQVTVHPGSLPQSFSFARLEPRNLVLTAMKKSEDDDSLIFRFYEWAGKSTTARLVVPPGAVAVQETNLMEKPTPTQRATLSGREVRFQAEPYSINTLRVRFAARPEQLAESSR